MVFRVAGQLDVVAREGLQENVPIYVPARCFEGEMKQFCVLRVFVQS